MQNPTTHPPRNTHFPKLAPAQDPQTNTVISAPGAFSLCATCGGTGEVDDYQDFGGSMVYAGTQCCLDCGGAAQ